MGNLNIPLPPKPAETQETKIKILVFLIGLFAVAKLLVFTFWPNQAGQASDLTINNILSAINKERSLRNLLTLNADSRLSAAAQYKAEDMLNRKYFSHTDPEGKYIWPKIEAAGYTPYLQLGENLAIEFYNTDSLVAAWMNSPTHRANILNEGFKDQGMGLDFGDVGLGQYHSSIANTFGALLVQSRQTAKAVPVQPAPVPAKPAPAAPTASQPPKISQTPAQQTPPSPAAPVPLAIRGGPSEPSFTTASKNSSATDSVPATSSAALTSKESPRPAVTAREINRYLSLGLGFILLILLLADLRKTLSNNLQAIDKKANNIVLLVLALIVVALMYWL